MPFFCCQLFYRLIVVAEYQNNIFGSWSCLGLAGKAINLQNWIIELYIVNKGVSTIEIFQGDQETFENFRHVQLEESFIPVWHCALGEIVAAHLATTRQNLKDWMSCLYFTDSSEDVLLCICSWHAAQTWDYNLHSSWDVMEMQTEMAPCSLEQLVQNC